jgi:predicted O-methyltransferase YrrM
MGTSVGHAILSRAALRVDYEEHMRKRLLKKYSVSRLPTIDLLDLFPDFHETISNYSFLDETCQIPDLAMLKLLAKRYADCQYLEIGLWRGESLASVAEVCKDCTSVSLSPDEMRRRRLSESYISAHGFFSRGLAGISYVGHDSRTFDFMALNKRFDLICIDADHHYENVKSDTHNAFELLRDERSVIVWHDYGFSPERVRSSVLAGILDGCSENKRKKLYHVSNTMCAIYTTERSESGYVAFPAKPNKSFTIDIKASRLENQFYRCV